MSTPKSVLVLAKKTGTRMVSLKSVDTFGTRNLSAGSQKNHAFTPNFLDVRVSAKRKQHAEIRLRSQLDGFFSRPLPVCKKNTESVSFSIGFFCRKIWEKAVFIGLNAL